MIENKLARNFFITLFVVNSLAMLVIATTGVVPHDKKKVVLAVLAMLYIVFVAIILAMDIGAGIIAILESWRGCDCSNMSDNELGIGDDRDKDSSPKLCDDSYSKICYDELGSNDDTGKGSSTDCHVFFKQDCRDCDDKQNGGSLEDGSTCNTSSAESSSAFEENVCDGSSHAGVSLAVDTTTGGMLNKPSVLAELKGKSIANRDGDKSVKTVTRGSVPKTSTNPLRRSGATNMNCRNSHLSVSGAKGSVPNKSSVPAELKGKSAAKQDGDKSVKTVTRGSTTKIPTNPLRRNGATNMNCSNSHLSVSGAKGSVLNKHNVPAELKGKSTAKWDGDKSVKTTTRGSTPKTLTNPLGFNISTTNMNSHCDHLSSFASITKDLYLKLSRIGNSVDEFKSCQVKEILDLEHYKNYVFHKNFKREFDLMLLRFRDKHGSKDTKINLLDLYPENSSSTVRVYGTRSELRRMVFYARVVCCGNFLLDSYDKTTRVFIKKLAIVDVGGLSDLVTSTRNLLLSGTYFFPNRAVLTMRMKKLIRDACLIPKEGSKNYSAQCYHNLCVLQSFKCSFIYDMEGMKPKIDELINKLTKVNNTEFDGQNVTERPHFVDFDSSRIFNGMDITNATYSAMLDELRETEVLQEQVVNALHGAVLDKLYEMESIKEQPTNASVNEFIVR